MRLIDDEDDAVPAAKLANRRVVARVGEHDSDVGERRLHEHRRDLPRCESGLEGWHIVERNDRRRQGRSHRCPDRAPAFDHCARFVEGGVGLIDGAVIAVVMHDDLRATGHLARVANEAAVRVGRREAELPGRHPESLGQHRGRCCGIRCRQHEGRALGELSRDRRNCGSGCMAAHCPGITETEVHVIDAIRVDEVRTGSTVHVDRPRPGPFGHPEHRHTVGQMSRSLSEKLGGPRTCGSEQVDLGLPETGEPCTIVVAHQPTLASRLRRAAALTCCETTRAIAIRNTAEAITFASAGIPRDAAI